MNKAVFLDRDGTINEGTPYYVHKIEHFFFNEGVFDACKLFLENGFKIIVITNQGVIAKGMYNKHDVNELHEYMLQKFDEQGIEITDIFFCPHHSDYENCLCRKPEPLMLQRAMAQYNIDPKCSWFIGDHKRDYDAGIRAGVNAIKIEMNDNLMNHVERILSHCP